MLFGISVTVKVMQVAALFEIEVKKLILLM